MPENTVYVGRGSVWGNPYVIRAGFDAFKYQVRDSAEHLLMGKYRAKEDAAKRAVYLFRKNCAPKVAVTARVELSGKNLACWCPPDQPCHADVLLELANKETP